MSINYNKHLRPTVGEFYNFLLTSFGIYELFNIVYNSRENGDKYRKKIREFVNEDEFDYNSVDEIYKELYELFDLLIEKYAFSKSILFIFDRFFTMMKELYLKILRETFLVSDNRLDNIDYLNKMFIKYSSNFFKADSVNTFTKEYYMSPVSTIIKNWLNKNKLEKKI